MFYRCTRPPTDITRLDLAQFARVQQFFDGFLPTGEHPGLVHTYTQPEEFERLVRQHLGKWVAEYAKTSPAVSPRAETPPPPRLRRTSETTTRIPSVTPRGNTTTSAPLR